jgi:hypothetical protein
MSRFATSFHCAPSKYTKDDVNLVAQSLYNNEQAVTPPHAVFLFYIRLSDHELANVMASDEYERVR